MTSPVDSLPIRLAIRLTLDSVSYSNPLPPWTDPLTINYSHREKTIAQKIEDYVNRKSQPVAPFEIDVPKRSGNKRRWLVPSINDQIIIQACVSALANKIEDTLDPNRVHSYRLNRDPNRLQLTHSQVSSWKRFQNEINEKLKEQPQLLQFDLEATYQSIRPDDFLKFIRGLSPGSIEVALLEIMMKSFASGNNGLPMINDSVFFLGNAYLRGVDHIVSKHTSCFIRFVDDYRVFGESRDILKETLDNISRELLLIGFKVNTSKVKLGTAEDYLETISKAKYATSTADSGYVSAAVFDDIIEPELLASIISKAIKRPDEFINEGFGRLIIGSIRRMRLNHETATIKGFPGSPLYKFTEFLSQDAGLIKAAIDLVEKYIHTAHEEWRVVWLLYVMQEVNSGDEKLSRRFSEILNMISSAPEIPFVARLWANKVRGLWRGNRSPADNLHDLGYLDEGNEIFGT